MEAVIPVLEVGVATPVLLALVTELQVVVEDSVVDLVAAAVVDIQAVPAPATVLQAVAVAVVDILVVQALATELQVSVVDESLASSSKVFAKESKLPSCTKLAKVAVVVEDTQVDQVPVTVLQADQAAATVLHSKLPL